MNAVAHVELEAASGACNSVWSKRRRRRTSLAVVALMVCQSGAVAHSSERLYPPRVEMRPIGESEVVFRRATDACDVYDIPDAPARAFRDADGVVNLFASHWRNRRLRGPELLAVQPDCNVVFEGRRDPAPERFDDRLWVASTWTADGSNVLALIHSEYQGHRHAGRCPTGRYVDCWYNVVSQAVSRDGGRSFRFERTPPPLVAAVPYRYNPNARRHVGFFGATNFVQKDGAWFVMVFTEGAGQQRRGNCLLRSERPDDPSAWRAWGGRGFDIAFADPYANDLQAEAHLCEPIGLGSLNWQAASLSRHESSGAFIAIMSGSRPRPSDGKMVSVLLASASWDLLRWSPPSPIREVATPADFSCQGEVPTAYPALLDPNASDRNFETVSASAMLFFTRFNLHNCRYGMDRDLLRMPVSIAVQAK